MKKSALKLFLPIISALILTAALSGCQGAVPSVETVEPVEVVSSTPLPVAEPQPEPAKVTFLAVGDNLIHGSLYLQAQRRATGEAAYDFTYLYEKIAYKLQNYDVNFINQETLVNNELPASTYPCFSTPGECGQAAYDAGFRVFGTSNNHIYDMGSAGISATQRYWSEMPTDVVTFGLYSEETGYENISLQTVNGITFAYLAYTQHTNGIITPANASAHIIYTDQQDIIEQQITVAQSMADVVVVSVHWGNEDSHNVSDYQRDLALKMTQWGADVILGTHPHVVQEIEWVTVENGNRALCAYSMGNFVSAQSQPDQLFGYALTFEIVKYPNENSITIENAKAIPVVTHYGYNYSDVQAYWYSDYTPELAASHGVHGRFAGFSKDYIADVLKEYISEDFLCLEE
ncbi:MAG: CapA family protein [Oscillospiraceae bacterium]|nr:CapA family protein [Oscillospiraceae bacterium]